MATLEDRQQLEEQARELRNRLNRLQIKKARFGFTADPAVEAEIDDLEFSIATIQRQIDGKQLLPEARAVVERYAPDNIAFLLSTVADLAERTTVNEELAKKVAEQQVRDSHWRLNITGAIEQLFAEVKTNDGKRRNGQRRNLALLIGIAVLGAANTGAIVWLITIIRSLM